MKIPFLTAYWQDLILINFEVDPSIVRKYLPRGTELDFFNGKTYVSLVAFCFNKNKLFGLIPTCPAYSFEEVNLRFYIKRNNKSAVAFIKEVVPSKLIASIARWLYNEPYVALRTSSTKAIKDRTIEYNYAWGHDLSHTIYVESEKTTHELEEKSIEEFILEHYWGYTAQPDARTVEYQVNHPKWTYSKVVDCQISDNVKDFYGKDFEKVLSSKPASIIVTEGSKISVSVAKRFFQPLNGDFPKGWVLYDGLCGFCSWWIPFWKKTIQKTGYDTAPVQSNWAKEKLGLSEAELNNDIRLLLNDGTLINGADAYIYGMKQVWWSFPIGWVLGLPIVRELTWKFYKIFNRNRLLVSKVCNFKAEI